MSVAIGKVLSLFNMHERVWALPLELALPL